MVVAPAKVDTRATEGGAPPSASPAHASSGSGASALDLIRVPRVPSASPLDPATQVCTPHHPEEGSPLPVLPLDLEPMPHMAPAQPPDPATEAHMLTLLMIPMNARPLLPRMQHPSTLTSLSWPWTLPLMRAL